MLHMSCKEGDNSKRRRRLESPKSVIDWECIVKNTVESGKTLFYRLFNKVL